MLLMQHKNSGINGIEIKSWFPSFFNRQKLFELFLFLMVILLEFVVSIVHKISFFPYMMEKIIFFKFTVNNT